VNTTNLPVRLSPSQASLYLTNAHFRQSVDAWIRQITPIFLEGAEAQALQQHRSTQQLLEELTK
jgi:hypothetical protein